MADENAAPETVTELPEHSALLAYLDQLKGRGEAALSAAEDANRKANSEAGYAYNARQNAEDHAKAIAQIKGTVEADFNWLTTTKKNADDAANAIVVAKGTAESDARLAGEARTSAEAEVTALRASKDKAEASFSATERVRDESTALAKRATEDAAVVTQARANVEASASTVQALQTQVSEAAAKVQGDGTSVAGRNTESQGLLASMAEVTETAKATHARVQAYETKLEELTAEFTQLHTKIEALLPGATSAGLASAFRNQKGRFTSPQRIWVATFSLAIVLLLAVGAFGLPGLGDEPVTWDSILRHVVSRLPLIGPLVWLALVAARNYNLALRLQEDYAYKEAISTSFEGYRREMAGIATGSHSVGPVLTLSDNVLRTLGERPGRLYDGQHEDLTPLTPITKLLREMKVLLEALGGGKRSATKDNVTEVPPE